MEAPATEGPPLSASVLGDDRLALRTRRLIRSREHFFWFLHLLGWAGYAIASYFGGLARTEGSAFVVAVLASTTAGMLLSLVMRYVYRELWYKSPWVVAFAASPFLICSRCSGRSSTIGFIGTSFNLGTSPRDGLDISPGP